MYEKNTFGEASNLVSVEECLVGEELSVFAVCDGEQTANIIGSSIENMRPEPIGIGTFEIENGDNKWEIGAYFQERPNAVANLYAIAFPDFITYCSPSNFVSPYIDNGLQGESSSQNSSNSP